MLAETLEQERYLLEQIYIKGLGNLLLATLARLDKPAYRADIDAYFDFIFKRLEYIQTLDLGGYTWVKDIELARNLLVALRLHCYEYMREPDEASLIKIRQIRNLLWTPMWNLAEHIYLFTERNHLELNVTDYQGHQHRLGHEK